MDFVSATRYMNVGYGVRRACWPSTHYMSINADGAIQFCSENKLSEDYKHGIQAEDVLADDWELPALQSVCENVVPGTFIMCGEGDFAYCSKCLKKMLRSKDAQ